MDGYVDDAEYAVFDDMDRGLRAFPFKCWLGAQHQFNVTDKYKKKKTIQWGKPTIFIDNDNPLCSRWLSKSQKDWLLRNTIVIHIANNILTIVR